MGRATTSATGRGQEWLDHCLAPRPWPDVSDTRESPLSSTWAVLAPLLVTVGWLDPDARSRFRGDESRRCYRAKTQVRA